MMGNPTPTSKRHTAQSSLPILLILTGIVVWSIAPFPTPDLPGVLEGLPHAVAYAALVWAALNVLVAGSTPRLRARWPRIVVVAFLSAVVGIGLEIAQAAVHRDAEVGDVVADLVGITAGVLAWLVADGKRRRRPRTP
jgi:VanZ family protein